MPRKFAVLFSAFALVMVLGIPAASAWSVGTCTFSGGNGFLDGNRAWAYTQATNSGCMHVYAKVHFKEDGYWAWSSQAVDSVIPLLATKNVYGADDADMGRHKAVASSGTPSAWKTSY